MTTLKLTTPETTAPKGPETIRLDMSWQAAASILALVLTDGTPEGQESARAELGRMASQADRVREMAEAVAKAEAEAETLETARLLLAAYPLAEIQAAKGRESLRNMALDYREELESVLALAAELAEMRETLAGLLDSFDNAQGATLRGRIDAARAKVRTIGTGAPAAPAATAEAARLVAELAQLERDSNDEYGDVILDGQTDLFDRIQAVARTLGTGAPAAPAAPAATAEAETLETARLLLAAYPLAEIRAAKGRESLRNMALDYRAELESVLALHDPAPAN